MPDKILKMLADKDSCDDAVNARIWCFEHGEKFVAMASHICSPCFEIENHGGVFTTESKYTTSLDAAMSIGVEELEGWVIHITQTGRGFSVTFTLIFKWQTDVKEGTNLPRAIAHARIQALEYVRSQNEK